MRGIRWGWAVWGILALWSLLGGCAPHVPPPMTPSLSYKDLAFHYAPVMYHGTASNQDYPTRFDFDNDWIGNNNWEHQPAGDLTPYVYYSVIETETHWFLFYSVFHPRDYTAEPCETSNGCHENDLESLQLVVLKDGSRYGKVQALETLAHNHIYLYPADETVTDGYLHSDGPALLEAGRPVVYIETYGHGIRGKPISLRQGKVTYRVGKHPRMAHGLQGEAIYGLLSIYDTLWPRREDIGDGHAFDRPFFYGRNVLPAAFDGDTYGFDKANTPWGYDQERGRKLHRGDWFLDPAKALAFHATFSTPFSHRYLFNPYLADLHLLSEKGENMRGTPRP